jgi:hypothetical protein
VTNARADHPVETAQVYLPGTRIGTLTNQEGAFRLRGVPPGEHESDGLGYGSPTRLGKVLSLNLPLPSSPAEPEPQQ